MDEALDVEALSRRYGPMVLRRCRRLLRDEDEALDACQDVFVRLLVHRERLDGAYPSSLLYRIATNVCLNRIRDRARKPESRGRGAACGDRIGGSAGRGERGARCCSTGCSAGTGVEPDDRGAALRGRLTLEEVARQTDLSVSGVRKRLRKLRQI